MMAGFVSWSISSINSLRDPLVFRQHVISSIELSITFLRKMADGSMKAVFWEGKPFHVSVKDTPRPTIQTPDDAIIRLTTAAICGTDLHTFHGKFGSSAPPWSLGHEGIGIVAEVGDNVTTLKVGDWVIVPDFPDDGHIDLAPPPVSSEVAFGFGPIFGNLGGLQGASFRGLLLEVKLKSDKRNTLDAPLRTNH